MKKKVIYMTALLLLAGLLVYYIFPEKQLPVHTKITYLEISKSKRTLSVYADGKLLKSYSISLGKNPVGAKQQEGDYKTPEGVYTINSKNASSRYHKNLGISYPNAEDIAYARQKHISPGGDIKIHGLKNGMGILGKFHRFLDWTQGCIAVTNDEIDELYDAVAIGTKIEIKQ